MTEQDYLGGGRMTDCLFMSDLHGKLELYRKFFASLKRFMPKAVFLGGELVPHQLKQSLEEKDFITGFLFPELQLLKDHFKEKYPNIIVILGNDAARSEEESFFEGEKMGLFHYVNQRKISFQDFHIYGYSFVPPTPFRMKDWEKYDVSRYVDPGCIPPTEGFRTIQASKDIEYETIQKDLETLTQEDDLSNAVFLFHSPPYKTMLDRAALDGQMIDQVPLDVHVGSIDIKRLIEERQPLLTMHGHIHESTRLTGHWMQMINRTVSFNASNDGPELSLISFNLEDPAKASRLLL